MELEIKNIGRIEKASIKIDGITVICGDNNTGKSTIGKTLYTIYHTFCNIQDQVENQRAEALINILHREFIDFGYRVGREAMKDIKLSLSQMHNDELKASKPQIDIFCKTLMDKYGLDNLTKSDKDKLETIILSVMEQTEADVLGAILKKNLRDEFGVHIGNVNYPRRKTDVKLKFRDGCIHFDLVNGSINPLLKEYINLKKRIVYIDDPFLLDMLDDHYILRFSNRNNHRMALKYILTKASLSNTNSVIEDLITVKRLKPILDKFERVSSGNLTYKDGAIKYESEEFKSELDIVSVSTGIKSFIILRELLINGSIEENGIIVIDEPEVHLHPEWQIRYAEIIVMLQKYYGLNILLTTHSDEFLSAIELYSRRYGVVEKCHYYMAKIKDTKDDEVPFSYFEEKDAKNLEEVYASLSQPYLDIYSQLNEEK